MYGLIAEYELIVAKNLQKFLKTKDFALDHTTNKTQLMSLIEAHRYDFLLLDLGLNDGCALDLIAPIVAKYETIKIVVTTARIEAKIAIRAYELGAFDYVRKPFDNKELFHILKRIPFTSAGPKQTEIFRLGSFVFDFEQSLITCNERHQKLTKLERQFFKVLLDYQPHFAPQKVIIEQLWGSGREHFYAKNSLHVAVHRLKKKLDKYFGKTLFVPCNELGYCLILEHDP